MQTITIKLHHLEEDAINSEWARELERIINIRPYFEPCKVQFVSDPQADWGPYSIDANGYKSYCGEFLAIVQDYLADIV